MIESKVYTCAYINHLQKLIVIRNLLRDTHLWAMLLVELSGRRPSNDIIREKWVSGLAVGWGERHPGRAEGPEGRASSFIKGWCVSRNYRRSWLAGGTP